jgi:hypothetical protein
MIRAGYTNQEKRRQLAEITRCVCGLPLSVRFLQALRRHPQRTYACPNSACLYAHQFFDPGIVRTTVCDSGSQVREAAFSERLLRPPGSVRMRKPRRHLRLVDQESTAA